MCAMTRTTTPVRNPHDDTRSDAVDMQGHADEAATLLRALANPQRLRILCLLVGAEKTVGEINAEVPTLSQSALSQHLARLREQRLVTTRREAQNVWYAMPPGPAEALIATLHGIFCAPDQTSRRHPTTGKKPARNR